MTDVRRIRGLKIAATLHIKKKGDAWIVPSESMNGFYAVTKKDGEWVCNCPDYELRRKKCKHGWAVEFRNQRELSKDQPVSPEPTAPRRTYKQDWPKYNLAQTGEKEHFCYLLRSICALAFPFTEHKRGRGRPTIPLDEGLFSACYKVYTNLAGRRFMTDMRWAKKMGHIETAPCYNSIFNIIESKESTERIKKLIEMSSVPLSAVEVDFAADSTGFGLARHYRHYSAKYGHDQLSRDYLKVHAMIGIKTHVVTAVEVTDRDRHDSPMFRPLLVSTNKRFKMREVSADKAYISRDALLMVDLMGATPYIPFKSNAKPNSKSIAWNRVLAYFLYRREEFLEHYHKRSNVESAFSSIKRKFGDFIRSKMPIAQTNEMLLKILAHNIVCLVHAMFELGIDEMFGYSVPAASPHKGIKLVSP